MAAASGRNVTITWNAVQINGCRAKNVTRNGAAIDVTSDEDAGERTLLAAAAMDEVSVSVSGVTKNSVLNQDWVSGTRTRTLIMVFPTGRTMTGTFFMQSYNEAAPYNDAVTFDAEFLSSGAVTETAGT